MKFTIQVAPEDCTGCGLCVDVCPAKNKSEAQLKAINMVPQPPLRAAGERELGFLPEASGTRPPQNQTGDDSPAAGAGAAVRVLRRVRGMRRNALSEAALAAVRRPRDRGQRDRLLLDLRRQPADHAIGEECRRPRPAWSNSLFEDNAEFGLGFRVSIDKQTEFAHELLRRVAGVVGEDLVTAILNAKQKDEAGHLRTARSELTCLKEQAAETRFARREAASVGCRHAGEEERLDHRRRRLGLRHRLRRPGSCAGQRTQCERARARHRGLLQHRRPGVEIHAARRGGEIRRGRQARTEEGSRPHGHDLRQRLRRQRSHGRER